MEDEQIKYGDRMCLQTKCSFNINGGGFVISCPVCCGCGATTNVINQDCETCLACEGEDGVLRNGKMKTLDVKIPKVIEVKV
jgi:hypothetical protein